MRKRKTKNYDQYATDEQEKARATAKAGQKNYTKKSGKASSQRRKKDGRASSAKKQRGGQRQSVFKLADFLTDETIKKLRGIENGRKTKSND